jgi:hypothetical protein
VSVTVLEALHPDRSRAPTRAGRALASIVAVSTLSACGFALDHAGVEQASSLTSGVAFARDFQGFEDWDRFDVDEAEGDDAVHLGADRTVYINALPGPGVQAFAVGTVIVKTGAGGEASGESGDEIHAMVKRGSGFNLAGATGWEWFELGRANDGSVAIVWRGEAPPTGESYGCSQGVQCDPSIGDCNACHTPVRGNDFVHVVPLP